MRINLTKEVYSKMKAAGLSHPSISEPKWGGDDIFLNTIRVSDRYLAKLHTFASKPANAKEMNGILQKVSLVRKALKDPHGQVVRDLNLLVEIALITMRRTKTKWLWHVEEGLPYLVSGAEYTPRSRDTAAKACISLKYISEGKVCSRYISFSDHDLTDEGQFKAFMAKKHKELEAKRATLSEKMKGRKKTVEEILGDDEEDAIDEELEKAQEEARGLSRSKTFLQLLLAEGFVLETDELIAQYEVQTADWAEKFTDHYTQFLFTTEVMPDEHEEGDDDSSYSWNRKKTKRAAIVAASTFRVVNDVPAAGLKAIDTKLVVAAVADEEDESDAADVFDLPVHPWVYVFNLETHSHMWVWAASMVKYVYDPKLVDRLIIKRQYKDLLRIMTEQPDSIQADFVAGKSGGTIVAALGPPGVGKSMSAEAYAESSERILYRVQSDQLGITPDHIEKNLKVVFARAERWNAILLVDEADIYIRARGHDIQQNAIVGTLLRTLEWFNGVIFMTSNRETVIDDAIISRCSAVIRYDLPTVEDSITIFNQFSTLFQVDISQVSSTEFFTAHKLSGRSIKNLLRLSARTGKRKPTRTDLEDTLLFLATEYKPETNAGNV